MRPFLFRNFDVMKRLLLLFALTPFWQMSFAQTDFCLPGAKWMYESVGTGQNPPRQSTYVYVGDTVIDGFSDVRIVKEELRGFNLWGDTYYQEDWSYSRQSGDSVFQFVEGSFELAFDLNVGVGDTRVVYFSADQCYNLDTMLIENVDTINYQGELLRRYHYKLLVEDQLSQIQGPGFAGLSESIYVERIGFMIDHPVLNGFRCEGNLISEYDARNFLCYTDNELAATYPDTCNLFLDAVERENQELEISVIHNQLQIQNGQNSTLRIYDILGKELYRTTIHSDNESMDVNLLPNGILMVVVESQESRFTKKVVKLSYL